jgi:hypothetical protein
MKKAKIRRDGSARIEINFILITLQACRGSEKKSLISAEFRRVI